MAGGFPDLVAPIVPVADNTAAKIIASGDIAGAFTRGFQAVSQANAQRRQAEIEIQRLAQQDALAQEQHGLEKQKLDQDYDFRKQQLQDQRPLLDARLRVADSMTGVHNANRDLIVSRIGINGDLAQKKAAVVKDFQERFSELDLDNPNPSEPVAFYENAKRLGEEYKFANLPEVKNALNQLKITTAQHTIPILYGTQQKQVPVGRIVDELNDPTKAPQTWQLLEKNGHAHTETDKSNDTRGWFDKLNPWGPKAPAPVVRNVADDLLAPYLNQAQGVDFSNSQPRVQPGWLRASPRTTSGAQPGEVGMPDDPATIRYPGGRVKAADVQGASDAMATDDGGEPALPAQQSSPDEDASLSADDASAAPAGSATRRLFEPTEVDLYLSHARNAISQGAPLADVAQRLQGMSIDPSKLWQA